jgi:hypothetical protein
LGRGDERRVCERGGKERKSESKCKTTANPNPLHRRKRQLAEQDGLERGEVDALAYRGEAKPEAIAWNPHAY